MKLQDEILIEGKKFITRRHFFKNCGVGLGSVALTSLLNEKLFAAQQQGNALASNPLAPKQPHFPGKAKRVIYVFQAGGPSHLDLFDYKPALVKYNGQKPPEEMLKGIQNVFINRDAALYASEFKFARHGQSGAEISEVLPYLAKVVDNICIVKTIATDAINHAPAQIFMNTGSVQFGRPSFGSWVTYGLGSESQNLPAFVVLTSANGTSGGSSNWGSGFLPTFYQGVAFRKSGDPILSLSNPRGITREMQRRTLDVLKKLNEHELEMDGDPEIATRINSFEMAYRMQESGPELMDLSNESKATLDLYGATPGKNSFANNCILARRLVERGVRFVQLYHEAWDHHSDVVKGVKSQAKATDQASAALIQDLKQRGLLEDTLVLWGGEFGRTPMVQDEPENNAYKGRDHHNKAYSMWFAGGGIKPGVTIGKTDELGFDAVEDRVHVHDLHATLLHQLGFDHEKLTFRFQGRDFRLTDVSGVVARKMLA
ncbi:MAG TPA: DUF1501 domain-containing protein [Blastocatellia bacterium]|nr:DUF1501 domain-containing protein [Blastocatellia bacterium]